MISISGKILNITYSESKDRETGEIIPVSKAEILHTSGGKSEIANIKLDPSIVEGWRSSIGQDITVEVKFGAMPGFQGGKPMIYMALADKHALPVLSRPFHQPMPKSKEN